jgi:hypothetical protein
VILVQSGAGIRARIIDPAKYFHLVEKGARPHAVGRGSRLDRMLKSGLRRGAQSGRMHPGFAGRHPMRNGFSAAEAQAKAAMVETLRKGIEAA